MKIVGNGLMATAFVGEDFGRDAIIFAGGVSNSTANECSQFQRERNLLDQCIADGGRLVYFSTCSIADGTMRDSGYVQHKL